MSFQKLILCGELTIDPELRYTPSGTACCAFRLKTVDAWVGNDGQPREEVEIHRIIVWGQDGERASKELKKGQTVLVEGKNKTRKVMGDNNLEVEITEVIAMPRGVRFLGGGPEVQRTAEIRPKPPEAPQQNQPAQPPQEGATKPLPAKRAAKDSPVKPQPPKPAKVSVDLAEAEAADDLPF